MLGCRSAVLGLAVMLAIVSSPVVGEDASSDVKVRPVLAPLSVTGQCISFSSLIDTRAAPAS